MPVVGIGTDIVDIDRIAAMSSAAKNKLALRILTAEELAQYQTHHHGDAFLAKRWAGKEGASKALGRGIADGVSFQHIAIHHTEFGQPTLHFTARALDIANALNASHWSISLSDERHYAVGFVVLSY